MAGHDPVQHIGVYSVGRPNELIQSINLLASAVKIERPAFVEVAEIVSAKN